MFSYCWLRLIEREREKEKEKEKDKEEKEEDDLFLLVVVCVVVCWRRLREKCCVGVSIVFFEKVFIWFVEVFLLFGGKM